MSHATSDLRLVGRAESADRTLVVRLLDLAMRGLPKMRAGEEFVFTLRGQPDGRGGWRTAAAGRSLRYAAITALGASLLGTDEQRVALAGESVGDLVGRLVGRLGGGGDQAVTSLGDAALICWAAAETGHEGLPGALDRLAAMDPARGGAVFTVDASWVVSALAAAHSAGITSAGSHYERARRRLVEGHRPGGLFSHEVGGSGLVPAYRAHVGCFADQVYPIQALARAGDDEAIKIAGITAERICAAQGDQGQWWWHYDSRTGGVVEGFPVYSVHQHAMAPMALFDLADAGGPRHDEEIVHGLRWMTNPAETTEPLILDDLGVTWRKTSRNDPKKAVRGVRAMTTRVRPGLKLSPLERVFPPVNVDRECRPYEFGWLLYTWLGGRTAATSQEG
jgi:hypothetical protein